jgi:hypothetical protein
MPVKVLYPYRTAAEMILLHLDIPERESSLDREQILPIYLCQSSTVTIRASAIVPNQVWQRVFCASEQSNPPAKLWLVVQSLESRLRKAYEFKGDQQIFELVVDLDRDEWAGNAEFQAFLVRSKLNKDLPAGYTGDLGARLAWSRTLLGAFEEPVPEQKDIIKIKWKKFEESQKSQLFMLEHSAPLPRLWLNANAEGLYDILNSRTTRGWNPAIAEHTGYLIAHQVWTSLLASTISHLAETGQLDRQPDITELLEWERMILDDWIESLFPDQSKEEALNLLVHSVRHHYFREELLVSRIPQAIQTKLSTVNGFQHLVREVGK